jgi:hypothetical protein
MSDLDQSKPLEMIASYDVIFEFVSSEEVKFDGNKVMYKHESYLHDKRKKYPTGNAIYLQEPMPEGFYSVQSELYISNKGKMEFRKIFSKVENNILELSRTGLATRKPIKVVGV